MSVIRYKGVEYGGPSVHIQSDTTATDLEDTQVPNGQTIKSFLDSKSNTFVKNGWNITPIGRQGSNYTYIFSYQGNLGTVAVNNSHGGIYYSNNVTINLPATIKNIVPVVNGWPSAYIIWAQIVGQSTTTLSIKFIGGMSSTNATVNVNIIAYAVTGSPIST